MKPVTPLTLWIDVQTDTVYIYLGPDETQGYMAVRPGRPKPGAMAVAALGGRMLDDPHNTLYLRPYWIETTRPGQPRPADRPLLASEVQALVAGMIDEYDRRCGKPHTEGAGHCNICGETWNSGASVLIDWPPGQRLTEWQVPE